MAGFETVVRPVIFPDIRPRARPALPPADDPTKGFAVIQGNPAVPTSNSHSWSVSSSHSKPVETQRRVDLARVYKKDDDGEVDEDTFVDVEVPTKITMDPAKGQSPSIQPIKVQSYYYARQEELDNIEILKRDVSKKNKGY